MQEEANHVKFFDRLATMSQPLLLQSITSTLSILLDSVQSDTLSLNRLSIFRNLDQVREDFVGSSLDDQKRSYAFLMNMLYQVLVISVNTDTCKLLDAKLACHSMQLIAQVVEVLYAQCIPKSVNNSSNNSTASQNHMDVFTEKITDAKMGSLLLVCLSLLEALHKELDIKGILVQSATSSAQNDNQADKDTKKKKGQGADLEDAVMATLKAFEYTIRAHLDGDEDNVKNGETEDGVRNVLDGDYLAHLVMMCVDFCKHKSKALASQALSTLLAAIEFTATPLVWRNFFPGVCGALFFECLQGPQRGSQVKERALICLLRLIASVSEGFDESIEESVQWRVDVLQRLQELLPRVYYSVFRSLSPIRKSKVLRCLCKLIKQARVFLGDKVSAEMHCLLLTSVEDDHLVVSRCSLHCWENLQAQEMQRGSWVAVREYLCTEVRKSIGAARRMAGTGREEELEQCLGRVLGCVHALRGELGAVFAQDKDERLLEDTLGFLLSPDPDSCQSSRIQSHTYAYYLPHLSGTAGATSPQVASYYQPPGLATRSPGNATRIRKLCVLLGQAGILSRLLVSVQQWQQHMSDVDTTLTSDPRFSAVDDEDEIFSDVKGVGEEKKVTGEGGGDGEAAVSEEEEQAMREVLRQKEQAYDLTHLDVLRKGAGLWKAVAEVMVGLVGKPIPVNIDKERKKCATGHISEVDAVQEKEEREGLKCAVCDITNAQIVRRCTRCLKVAYCGREHQLQHWKSHKKDCKQLAEQHAITPSPSPSATDSEQTGKNCDIFDDTRLYTLVVDDKGSSSLYGHIIDSEEVLSSWWMSVPMSYHDLNGATVTTAKSLQPAYESIDEVVRSAVAAMAHHICFLKSRYASDPTSIKGTLRSLLLANVAEAVAHASLVNGPEAFQPHLITTLYPLLELSVSSEDIIRVAGRSSVQRLALYLNYPSVAHLLHGNMDYIVDEVCAAMRPRGGWNYRLGTTTFDAVARKRNTFLIKKSKRGDTRKGDYADCGEEEEEFFGPHLVVEHFFTTVHEGLTIESEEIDSKAQVEITVAERINSHAVIRDLLRDAISSMDTLAENGGLSQRNTLPLLAMMKVLVMKAAEPLEVLPSQSAAKAAGDVLAAKAKESLAHFQRNIDILMERNPVIDDKDIITPKVVPSSGTEGPDGEAKETPPGLALIEEVLARCSYYLSLPSLRDKVKVVDIMQQALLRLAVRRDVLLPAVHKLWRPLILRVRELRGQFQDEVHQRIPGLNEMSKRKSFLLPVLLDLLAMLADITTNFYSVKWDDDLWPELVVILQCVAKTCISEAIVRQEKEMEKKRYATSGKKNVSSLLSSPTTTPSSTMPHLELAEEENTAISSEKFFRMEMYSERDLTADTSILDTMIQAGRHSKFFRANKLRIAVCRCIQRIADMPECEPYVRKAAGVCFWHGLPLLLDPQPEVRQAVSNMMHTMVALDRSFGRCALDCIALAANAHGASIIRDTANACLLSEARIRWNTLATDLRIVTSCELFERPYHPYLAVLKGNKRKTTKLITAPNATQTLTTLVADEEVVNMAREMLQQGHISPAVVNSWMGKLESWKSF